MPSGVRDPVPSPTRSSDLRSDEESHIERVLDAFLRKELRSLTHQKSGWLATNMKKEGEGTYRASKEVAFRSVGVVRTRASDEEVRERSRELEATIEIFPEFEEALDGLDGFSHIFVLSHLDRLRPEQIGVLKVRPRRLVRKGFKLEELPLVGVFALDSPTRPNPIALSLNETCPQTRARTNRFRPRLLRWNPSLGHQTLQGRL
jgi:tRNA (Thr-GGU) A37 N-methylase